MNEVAGQVWTHWKPALAAVPRAPAFIVTLYGDVVEPRGGMLWMGSLIAVCAVHGLSESLVRTAVSRLVGAGRLEGVRIGRKSYYRLSETARDEFRNAARLLFTPPAPPEDWLLCLSDGLRDSDLPPPWTRLSASVALAPNTEAVPPLSGVLMRAKQIEDHGDLIALARDRWNLKAVADAYRGFLEAFGDVPLGQWASEPESALALRLRLVHDYRHAALNDPRLPSAALPRDWPAEAARRLFITAYADLTKAAERIIPEHFFSPDGPLAPSNAETDQRLFHLKSEAAG